MVTSRTLARLLPGVAGSVYLLRASQDRAEAISQWGEPLMQSAPHLLPEDCCRQPHSIEDLQPDALCPTPLRRSPPHACRCRRKAPSSVFCFCPRPAQAQCRGPGNRRSRRRAIDVGAEQLALARIAAAAIHSRCADRPLQPARSGRIAQSRTGRNRVEQHGGAAPTLD